MLLNNWLSAIRNRISGFTSRPNQSRRRRSRSHSKREDRMVSVQGSEALEQRALLTVIWQDALESALATPPTVGDGTRDAVIGSLSGPNGAGAGSDHFQRTSDNPHVGHSTYDFSAVPDPDGGSNFYWVGEDIEDVPSAGTPSQATLSWTGITITGASNLELSGFFGARATSAFEETDSITVTAQIDGGTVQELLDFHGDVSGGGSGILRVDTNGDGLGDGTALGTTMTLFNNLAITGTGDSLDIVITVSTMNFNEEIAFDHFTLDGTVAAGDIEVRDGTNTTEIPYQDMTPSTAEGSDFGIVAVGGNQANTFRINNVGAGDLTLIDGDPGTGGNQFVTISGADAGQFSVSAQPGLSTLPGTSGNTNFNITYNPGAAGIHNATVSIHSDDGDENPFTFDIRGQAGPEIEVRGNSVIITDGDTTPDAADHTDFGEATIGSTPVSRTFRINNIGQNDLDLNGSSLVAITGSADFTVTSQPATDPIPAGGFAEFTVEFDPSTVGTITATVVIESDDLDEDPFNFDVQGLGRGSVFWTDDFESSDSTPPASRLALVYNDPDGGDDSVTDNRHYFRRTDGTPGGLDFDTNFTGFLNSNYWRSEIVTGAGDTDSITWTGIDTTGRTAVQFSGLFGAADTGSRFEAGDFILVEAQIDGAGGFTTFLEFHPEDNGGGNAHMAHDTNGDSLGDGVRLDANLQEFVALIPTPGNSLDLRITVKAEQFEEEYAFDHFTLESPESLSADIEVRDGSNNLEIAFNDTTPQAADGTDYGDVATGGSNANTFTINNIGNLALNLEDGDGVTPGDQFVTISGAAAGQFTVTTQPGTSTLPATTGTTTFVVTYNPSAAGSHSATVEIHSDDPNEDPFTFSIQGFSGPRMTVSGNTVDIPDGDTSPEAADHTAFGAVPTAGGSVVRTFTITNTGPDNLDLTAGPPTVTITGPDASSFTLTDDAATPVTTPNGTETFQITFDPASTGRHDATINIDNNDPATGGSYTFDIVGFGRGVNFWTDNFESTAPSQGVRDLPHHTDNATEMTDGEHRGPGDYFQRVTNNPGPDVGLDYDNTFTGILDAAGSPDQSASYWRAEDLNGSGGTNPDVINWTGINISGRSELLFSGWFGADDGIGGNNQLEFEDSDFIRIEADTGGGFQNILEFRGNNVGGLGQLAVDTNGDNVGDGEVLGQGLTEFLAEIPGTGTTLSIRLTASLEGFEEEVAFDHFTLESGTLPEVTLSLSTGSATEAATTVVTAIATADKPVVGNQTVDVDVVVAGDITSGDFDVVTGTITILDGQTTGTFNFTVQDDALVEANETATIEISTPSSGVLLGSTTSDTVEITDNDSATVNIAGTTNANEAGLVNGLFTVTQTAAASTATTLSYSVGGTSTSGDDFTALSGTVTINAGDTTATIPVAVINDLVAEPMETLVLTLTGKTAGDADVTIDGGGDNDTINILDNDQAILSIEDISIVEGDAGATTFTFTVTLDTEVEGGVSFDYETVDDTATTADNDYTGINTTTRAFVATTANSTETIDVDVDGDEKVELNEDFFLRLSNIDAGGADVIFTGNVATLDGTGTIQNDDNATISIDDVSLNEGDAGDTTFTFTVTLDAEVDSAVSFDFATVDDSATTGDNDYTGVTTTNRSFTTTTANSTETIDVLVTGDTNIEPDEDFLLRLTNLSAGGRAVTFAGAGASLDGTGTIVNDDNTPPTVSIGNLAYTEDQNGGNAVQIDAAATANDADGDAQWTGGTLVVQLTANAEGTDELTVIDNLVGNINSSGTDLRDNTTVIGTLSAAEGTVTGGNALTITFNSNATNALVQDTLRSLGYRTTSNMPSTATRTLTATVTDAPGDSDSDTGNITVAAANDPATVTLSPATLSIPENASTATKTKVADIIVNDPDVADVVYDFTTDFSTIVNPNGVWTYKGAGGTPFTTYNGGSQRWQNGGAPVNQGVGPGIVQPDSLQPANVLFTAPVSAVYSYSVTLDESVESGGTGIGFFVQTQSAPGAAVNVIDSGSIADGAGPQTYTGSVFLAAGGTMEVGTGDGSGGTGDRTGLTMTLTREPDHDPPNVLSLSGAESGNFLVMGLELFLAENAQLDFETNPDLQVNVDIDDPAIAGSPDNTALFTLNLTDVNEPPVVQGRNILTHILEGTILNDSVRIATINVADDALGTETLSLTGADAAFFEFQGLEVHLKAGTILDFETKPFYDVTVAADDTSIPGNPDSTLNLRLQLLDVFEPPEADVSSGGKAVPDNGVVNFGDHANGAAQPQRMITITNNGQSDLTIQPAVIPAGFVLVGANFSSNQQLNPGADATITVAMQTGGAGEVSGVLRIPNNDPNESNYRVNLAGAIITPSNSPTSVPLPVSGTGLQIDNGDAGYHATGGWNPVNNYGANGDAQVVVDPNGGRRAIWAFGGLAAGQYDVNITWLNGGDRSDSVPVVIRDGIGGPVLASTTLNQKVRPSGDIIGGRPYQRLDRVNLAGDTLIVELSNEGSPGAVIADAVVIVPFTPPPNTPEITVRDNNGVVSDGSTFNFAAATVGGSGTQTFTVRNDGTADLILQPVSVTGAKFSVGPNLAPNTLLAPGQSVTFDVTVDTSAAGIFNGTLTFDNNDGDEDPFNLNLAATVRDPNATVVLVDDGEPGFSLTANWVNVPNYGFRSDAKVITPNLAGTATWTFTGLTAGDYDVSTTWLNGSDRATAVTYVIRDGVAGPILASVPVNQRVAPAGTRFGGRPFNSLGTVSLAGTTMVVEVSNVGTDGAVIADAVRIEAVVPAPNSPEIDVRQGQLTVLDGGSFNLGSADQGDPQLTKVFTVENTGTASLTLEPITVTGTGFSLVSANFTPGQVLAPAGTVTFEVGLSTSTLGTFQGNVSFANSDADENPFNFGVSGTINEPLPAGVFIIDNGDTGHSTTGNWTAVSGFGFGSDALAGNGVNGVETSRWEFTGLTSGSYAVSATWLRGGDREASVDYVVRPSVSGSALGTATVDQTKNPSGSVYGGRPFEALGTFTISGSTLVVDLSTAGTTKAVIADAIRIELIAPGP